MKNVLFFDAVLKESKSFKCSFNLAKIPKIEIFFHKREN